MSETPEPCPNGECMYGRRIWWHHERHGEISEVHSLGCPFMPGTTRVRHCPTCTCPDHDPRG